MQNLTRETSTAAANAELIANCQYKASGETTLRCAKCERPLMVKDAVRTPTGYVCPYFVKGRVATFYNAGPQHYLIAALVALVGGAVTGFILQIMSGIPFIAIILTLAAAPAIGTKLGDVIGRAIKPARGQYIWLVAAIAIVIGGAYFAILPGLLGLFRFSLAAIFDLIPAVGLAVMVGAVIRRLRL
ncbi:MAG: hypothetical protein KIH69_011785 [Anaerolineae bacterium]|nr:hypothetical protein [Anaerolineae bacterium]